MKRIFYLLLSSILVVACWSNTNSNNKQTIHPLVTYIYDGDKEICLYPDDIATVDGKSGIWHKREKDFYHSDGISLDTTTREYIWVEYGSETLIIWPGTGLVFFGRDNANASFDNPSNDRNGKRCYRKR